MKKTHERNYSTREQMFQALRAGFELVARRRVGPAMAEDIAQEACVTVLQRYDSREEGHSFESWAYQILRNVIGNHLQKNRVRRESAYSLEITQRTEQEPPDPDLRIRLQRCLNKLNRHNQRYAQVLKLAFEGYTTGEICRQHGITPQNLYVLLNRSRSILRKCLEAGRN